MDAIAFLGLMFLDFALPAGIVALALTRRLTGYKKGITIGTSVLTILLSAATIINGIIGLLYSGEVCYEYTGGSRWYYDCYYRRSACAWVAFGLGIGAFVVGLAALLLVIFLIRSSKNSESQAKQNQPQRQVETNQTSRGNLDYIEEIKRLKELLDCGAITQEEYDAKKTKLLE